MCLSTSFHFSRSMQINADTNYVLCSSAVFHKTPKLSGIFPESCLVIVVGALIGGLLWYALSLHVPPLTPNTFFFYMLPPIVLNAGYLIPNRKFFENITTILVLAVIGALFNIATIGSSLWACGQTGIFGVDLPFLHILLFSSLIAAVDPVAILTVFEDVNEVLHIVAFGEMLLNYAVTIIMYHMFAVYNEIGVDEIKALDIAAGIGSFFVIAIGGSIVGIIWGFVTGIVTRFTDHVQIIEPIFILVMAYLAYLNAEVFHVSGILAILGVFMLSTLANYFRTQKLTTVDQFVISFGGLRGAVAFALVLLVDKHRFPLQPMFLTTTIAVIFFTMFLQGITVKPLADILDAKRLSQHKPNMDEQSHELEMV
uniref:Sodium/hydrogen exchanger n=1 Tax=Anopheles minimus TaxID=112268 RepID=A0A182VSJ5_9DIPT